jgi:hypothetical protein
LRHSASLFSIFGVTLASGMETPFQFASLVKPRRRVAKVNPLR